MSSGIYYPAVSIDDGFSIKSYDSDYVYQRIGYEYGSWVRFTDVTIPKGSSITEAYITFTARYARDTEGCNAKCYFNDVDDAVAPPEGEPGHTSDGYNALVKTSAVVDWDAIESWPTVDAQYNSPELKTILQEIVDRAGWASGNAVQVMIEDNGSTEDSQRLPATIDYDSGSKKAELHVEWESGDTSEDINVLSEFDDSMGEIDEGVSVLSEFDDSMGETSDNVNVLSEFNAIGDNKISENVSANTAFIGEHLGEISENASVESEFVSAHFGELSENASVKSEFEGYGYPADIVTTLPSMTADLTCGGGASIEASLPALTADIKSGAYLSDSLPMITAELEGKVGRSCKVNAIVPMITASLDGKAGILGDITAELPLIRVSIQAKTGKVATITVSLPAMEASLEGYDDITGDIDATLPLISPYMVGTPARSACTILRYTEPI